jgi:hypothetical protein
LLLTHPTQNPHLTKSNPLWERCCSCVGKQNKSKANQKQKQSKAKLGGGVWGHPCLFFCFH